MSFHETCEEIIIENQDGVTVLFASVQNDDGSWEQTSLVLDEIIGFEDGCLVWGGGAFTEIAETVDLYLDEFGAPYLRISLSDDYGELVQYELNLAERIAQQGGCLVFIDNY